jgi:atypical dual specificity phosphatase
MINALSLRLLSHMLGSFSASGLSTALAPAFDQRNGAPKSKLGRAASLIVPRVYLSDYFTARDPEVLNRLGITHVISVLEQDTNIPDLIPLEHKLHIRIPDQADADILVHLDQTTEFIITALVENASNKVLVSFAVPKMCTKLKACFIYL